VPIGNTGLHNVQTLETYGSAAEIFVSKTKKYKSGGPLSGATLTDQMYRSKLTE
jgi:hypothetical protein